VIGVGGYERAPGVAAATWIVEGLRGFAESVLSVVPEGFEAYARIFHPAILGDSPPNVRWRDVAAANGRIAHPAMQWPSIAGSIPYVDGASLPGVWDQEPEEGCLPQDLMASLASALARHTATPDRCWFAVWDGYGSLGLPDDQFPVFDIPKRSMLLLAGPITAVRTSVSADPFWQSPNLWWPDDRAWCVATEIDFMSTYLGGTRRCLEELLSDQELEAVIIQPTDGITWTSDPLNPSPEQTQW
jgi:hypothetical protein